MAYYAFLDDNNIVTEVISGKDETELLDGLTPEEWYGNFRGQRCIRTSYNTAGGVHLNGGTPFRKNFASIGDFYDEERDAFYMTQPYPSWTLDEETCQWFAPKPFPNVDYTVKWDEATLSWIEDK